MLKNNKDWFRGTEWDKQTQEEFEKKLKQSRGTHNKAQYLRIKASCLLNSGDSVKESEGCRLMERLVSEYPNELSHIMFGYEQLGDYFFARENYFEAEVNFRKSISYYKREGRSGTSGIADIKLAETIYVTNQIDKFQEMYNLLINEFHGTGGSLTLNEDIFRYYSVLAKLSDKLDKKVEASKFSKKALSLAGITEPQFDKYPQLGLIKISDDEIKHLKIILSSISN